MDGIDSQEILKIMRTKQEIEEYIFHYEDRSGYIARDSERFRWLLHEGYYLVILKVHPKDELKSLGFYYNISEKNLYFSNQPEFPPFLDMHLHTKNIDVRIAEKIVCDEMDERQTEPYSWYTRRRNP